MLRNIPFCSVPLSQGYAFPRDACFPTHIPRDACFPTHIAITKATTDTSHSDMCVPGKCVSPEISLNFISLPQF